MRRIIERVVTVVTTTTWKISWEPESSPQSPTDDSNSLTPVRSEPLPGMPRPAAVEAKEVDESLMKDLDETNGG
jgi:hypothetical protein